MRKSRANGARGSDAGRGTGTAMQAAYIDCRHVPLPLMPNINLIHCDREHCMAAGVAMRARGWDRSQCAGWHASCGLKSDGAHLQKAMRTWPTSPNDAAISQKTARSIVGQARPLHASRLSHRNPSCPIAHSICLLTSEGKPCSVRRHRTPRGVDSLLHTETIGTQWKRPRLTSAFA